VVEPFAAAGIVPRYLDFKYHADRLDRMILEEMAAGRR
jgi:hypothetical protein